MSEIFSQDTEVKAVAKRIRMAPNKIRRVLRQIKGKSYKEALTLVEFLPYSSCKPVTKVLRSAVANAKNNLGLDETQLGIKAAFTDKGPVIKRIRPRAQGRAYKILKATSSITIVLSVDY
jgi:large subunit ribosomal protein L22